jgi:hypothetical protein
MAFPLLSHPWLLTKKRLFSLTSANAVKCHIFSAVLWLDYLQTSLFISIDQTGVCQQSFSISLQVTGKA